MKIMIYRPSQTIPNIEMTVSGKETIGWLIYKMESDYIQKHNNNCANPLYKLRPIENLDEKYFRHIKISLVVTEGVGPSLKALKNTTLSNVKYLKRPIKDFYKEGDKVLVTKTYNVPFTHENPANKNDLIFEEYQRVESLLAVEPNTLKNMTLGFIKKNEGLLKITAIPNLLSKELVIDLENANEEMTKTVILSKK